MISQWKPQEYSSAIPASSPVITKEFFSSGGNASVSKPTAEISLCTYDRIPCGIVSEDLLNRAEVKNQRGESLWGGNGSGCWTVEYSNRYVNFEPDDLHVTVEYERFGKHVELVVPLPKEVTP